MSGKNPNTPTTVKIATLTGAAKDDVLNVLEGSGQYELDVLANDPGSAKLYSLAQVSGISTAQFPIVDSITLASGAVVSMVNGKLVYSNAAVQSLAAGETLTETFTYTIRMANGALSQATASVTVTGENDDATISGDNSGFLTEDDLVSVNGQLQVTDVDNGEARFADLADGALQGTYGTFSFNVLTGEWTYDLNNDSDIVQALGANDVVYDELVVTSFDGTASETIRVTITGKDEASTGGSGGDVDVAMTKFIVNHGQNFVNGLWSISNFNSNSYLQFAGTQIVGVSEYDYGNDGVQDTVVTSFKANGAGAGFATIVLVGYTGFNSVTQVDGDWLLPA